MSDLYNKASLVMTPQLVDTGKVYSIKPEDRKGDFTFTRSSAATRVNADGNIEKETQNLFLQSNSFDTTWAQTRIDLTSGQSGYDGSSDAWKLESNDASTTYLNQNISASGVQTTSLYAKAGTADYFAYYTSSGVSAWFNLSNGSIGNTGSNIDTQIEDVGNGWYRCSMSYNASISYVRIYVTDVNGNFTSAVGANIYIQDAQLEQGLVARDYIETTTTAVEGGITDNVPRLDYTDSSCPALLLEPQRTNIVTQSEYFEDGYWNKQNAIAINTNSDLSPEGIQNATELDGFDASNFQSVAQYITLSAGTYTFSVFLKKTTGALTHYPAVVMGSVYKYVIVNSTTGTYVEATGTNNNDSVIIESWDADWWRVSLTNTLSAGAQRFAIYPALSANGTGITTNASGTNVFWGAQVEEGSYATSYIPTYGSSVTRNRDNMDTTFSSPLATNGNVSVLFDFGAASISDANSTANNLEFVFDNGDKIIYNQNAVSQHRIELNVNGGTEFIYKTFGILRSIPSKICVVVTNKTYRFFVNGELISSAGSFTGTADWTAAERFASDINEPIGVTPIKQLLLFPTALTDDECIALTTL